MKKEKYLFDTHALYFWTVGDGVSGEFINFFDGQNEKGNLYFSSVSIWEIALLKKKGRIAIKDLHKWKDEIISNSAIKIIDPTSSDMIDSALLPDHHKDPFDRLLIAQAVNNNSLMVSRDVIFSRYPVKTFWV